MIWRRRVCVCVLMGHFPHVSTVTHTSVLSFLPHRKRRAFPRNSWPLEVVWRLFWSWYLASALPRFPVWWALFTRPTSRSKRLKPKPRAMTPSGSSIGLSLPFLVSWKSLWTLCFIGFLFTMRYVLYCIWTMYFRHAGSWSFAHDARFHSLVCY